MRLALAGERGQLLPARHIPRAAGHRGFHPLGADSGASPSTLEGHRWPNQPRPSACPGSARSPSSNTSKHKEKLRGTIITQIRAGPGLGHQPWLRMAPSSWEQPSPGVRSPAGSGRARCAPVSPAAPPAPAPGPPRCPARRCHLQRTRHQSRERGHQELLPSTAGWKSQHSVPPPTAIPP